MDEVKLICLDVDGTLTDGKIFYDNYGNELKSFNVKDGMAIAQGNSQGILFAIITGRQSEVVVRRAKDLGIFNVHQGVKDKLEVIKKISKENNITPDEILFIGDDINDLKSMMHCKYSACPADACTEVKKIANVISRHRGGEGAVREIVELILREKKLWDEIVNEFKFENQ